MMATSSSNAPCDAVNDRIYLGGIDPLHGLTVSDVLERLQARVSSEGIVLQDVHQGRCYVQFKAVAVRDYSTSNPTPLEKIKSWFHNVTWKGCKLVVEKARPHLLQRLQEERDLSLRLREGVPATNPTTAPTTAPQPVIKRHWKVKRGYSGEPLRHVDTLPCEVTDWGMFARVRKRHETQQEKTKELTRLAKTEKTNVQSTSTAQLKQTHKLSYYNRSIHLKFSDDPVQRPVTLLGQPKDDNSIDTGSDESSASNSTKYAWSDDDESDTVEKDGVGPNRQEEIAGRIPLGTRDTDDDHGNKAHKSGPASYVWSDDESSGQEESLRANPSKTARVKTIMDDGLNEFAAAMDTDTDAPLDDGEWAESQVDDDSDEDRDLLRDDVESNLRVLAQLFPDSAPQPKVAHDAHSASPKAEAKASSGWGAFGQMLRFDPSKPQMAQQFVLRDDDGSTEQEQTISAEEGQGSSDEIQAKSGESPSNEGAELQLPPLHETQEKSTVYEQDKLEQVFRDVRESAPNTGASSGSAFSFGFDLGSAQTPSTGSAASFAFSFLETKEGEKPHAETAEISTAEAATTTTADDPDAKSIDECRSLAFEYPNTEQLDSYVHHFYYNLNDGARIINDLEGWRNDPNVKQQWLKKRLALTQDWKRKHKYALSKKQKRFR
jgi:hypothetical protein